MSNVKLTPALRAEYQNLFDTCVIRPARQTEVETIVNKISANKQRYVDAGNPFGVPWYFVGAAHSLETSLRFNLHLHNGDPLTARTVRVPKGRPAQGNPPFTWEVSAADALAIKKLNQWNDWSLPGTLYKLEGYNGYGYRAFHPEVLSPYLWSFSTHYTKGKYVSDGTFSPTAVSAQCGAAVILRRMAEKCLINFKPDGQPVTDPDNDTDFFQKFGPLVKFSNTKKSALAEELQRALNKFPGIFVKVDGVPGNKTSEAFKRVTGHFLVGDPRANG